MTRVAVITAPAAVVTWAQADEHLKLDGDTSQQAYVEGLIAAATAHIDGPDGWLGRAIGVQTLEATLPTWCVHENFRLPCPPLIAVDQISYRDAARQTVIVPADSYAVTDDIVEAIGSPAWASARGAVNGLRVRYRAGYEAPPMPICIAILMMVDDLYRNRGNVGVGTVGEIKMPMASSMLLQSFRVYS